MHVKVYHPFFYLLKTNFYYDYILFLQWVSQLIIFPRWALIISLPELNSHADKIVILLWMIITKPLGVIKSESHSTDLNNFNIGIYYLPLKLYITSYQYSTIFLWNLTNHDIGINTSQISSVDLVICNLGSNYLSLKII